MTVEFRTMSHRSSALSKSLNSALETFTFGDSSCVYLIASSEDISFDFVFYVVLFRILKTELSNESLVRYASLVKVTLYRLVYKFLSLINKANLYSFVSIVLLCLNLCHYARTSLKNCYRNKNAFIVEDLSHSDFCS